MAKKLQKRFHSIPAIPKGRKYLVMIANYWGKGDTLAQAIEQVENAGGRLRANTRCKVFDVEPKAFIDEMGAINWFGKDGKRLLAQFEGGDA